MRRQRQDQERDQDGAEDDIRSTRKGTHDEGERDQGQDDPAILRDREASAGRCE